MTDSDDAIGIAPLLDKVFVAARPGLAFSAPVVAGAYTIITASEVVAGGGFGLGGSNSPSAGDKAITAGHGGGAGGGASTRPVAAIVIGPDGVKVKPIIDITKIALAGITAWGAMGIILARMVGGSRKRIAR